MRKNETEKEVLAEGQKANTMNRSKSKGKILGRKKILRGGKKKSWGATPRGIAFQ